MLIVNPNDTFKVNVIYKKNSKGEVEFLEKRPEGEVACEEDWFEFRFPNWSDVQAIMSQATRGGSLALDNIDGMSFMDSKIKTLLKSWSLKDDNGKALPLDHVDRLPASVMMHLSTEIDKELGPNGLFGVQS